MQKQPPTFLVEALRQGITGLGEHPLAAALAAGTIGGPRQPAEDPPGFHPAQADAHRACLGEGVHLVWGPPGTGKTTVLKRAIGDLLARGDRLLLVSATNIAVDNALLGVVRERRHGPGEIVRVGPPHLKEVAEDPSVSLPMMVRARLAETAQRRGSLESELVAIKERAAELARLEAVLTRFDSSAYYAALELLRTPGEDPASVRLRVEDAKQRHDRASREHEEAVTVARTAVARDKAAAPARHQWHQVDELSSEVAKVREAVALREAAALLAEDRCDPLRRELREAESTRTWSKRRAQNKTAGIRQRLEEAERSAATARQAAARPGPLPQPMPRPSEPGSPHSAKASPSLEIRSPRCMPTPPRHRPLRIGLDNASAGVRPTSPRRQRRPSAPFMPTKWRNRRSRRGGPPCSSARVGSAPR
ncbi:AAA domain-containing protein [Streptomyces sp. 71268]|uniref:AAA domain-containing protein n=1 Tax=Streptomyces sp. 71268 TaxID=3002640 RepID=UPI0032B29C09